MDPNAAWQELCEELNGVISEDNIDRAVELAEGLVNWMTSGGAAPKSMEHVGRVAFGRIAAAVWGSLRERRKGIEEELRRAARSREMLGRRTMAWLMM